MRLDVEAARRAIEEQRGAAPRALTSIAGGLGHPSSGQREHGGGRAHPRHRAGQGPPRLSALRVRRRRPRPRLGRWAASSGSPACSCPSERAPSPPTGSSPRRSPSTSSAPRPSASTPRTGRGVNRALRRDGGGRPCRAAPVGRGRGGHPRSAGAPRCATSARATRSRRECRRARSGRASLGAHHRGASRPPTARSTAAHPLGVAIEALNWRAVRVGPAPGRRDDNRRREARRSSTGRRRRPGKKHAARRTSRRRADYVDTPVYDRYALAPGATLRGPRHRRGARIHHRHRSGRAGASWTRPHAGRGARVMRRAGIAPRCPPGTPGIMTARTLANSHPGLLALLARASTCSTSAADRARSPSRSARRVAARSRGRASTSTRRCSRRPGRRARPARCPTCLLPRRHPRGAWDAEFDLVGAARVLQWIRDVERAVSRDGRRPATRAA